MPFHFEQTVPSWKEVLATLPLSRPQVHENVRRSARIGADGAFSAVRDQVMKQSQLSYDQTWIESGYVELSIPPTADGDWPWIRRTAYLAPSRLHADRTTQLDKSFTVTLFLPFKSENDWCFDRLKSTEDVRSFFNEQFADSVPLMPKLIGRFF